MGTVHGVYLKYVGLSALSLYGYSYFMRDDATGGKVTLSQLLLGYGYSLPRTLLAMTPSAESAASHAAASASSSASLSLSWRSLVPALIFGYSAVVNGVIAVLFKLEIGMSILGKNRTTGTIPKWSYIVFFPFHIPTLIYTHIHTLHGKHGRKPHKHVPVATEVQPGWWVGGWYAHELGKEEWAGVIDLTVEFPETCMNQTRAYLSLPTWDGVPCTPAQLEQAATFAVQANNNSTGAGDVLVHCAHGRGRSTTVLCACLVKAGLFSTWQEAFEKGIKPKRPVCKLNRRMRQNLQKWQEEYVVKGQ